MKKNLLSVILVALALGSSVAMAVPAPAKNGAAKPGGVGLNAQRSLELNEQGATAVRNKDFPLAESFFKQALQVDSHNLTAAFNLAGMYITNKNEGAAVELLKQYTAQHPDDAGLYSRLGDAYFGTKKIDLAIANYEQAFKLAPNYEALAGKLGTVYALVNRTADAERMFRLAIKQTPKDAQLYANLSSLCLVNKKSQDAITNAKIALQLKPSPDVYITLGNAYQQIKDLKNALIAYQRAVDLGKKDPELQAVVDDLKKRTGTA